MDKEFHLKNYFDKVYVINLIDRLDRKENMIRMFTEMGFYDELFDGTIEFYDAVKLPFLTEELVEDINKHNIGNTFSYATNSYNVGLTNCSIEHYRVLYTAYHKCYERVLILEDDARFIKNLSQLKKCFDNIPSDFNILHLEGLYYYVNEIDKQQHQLQLSNKIEQAYWNDSRYFNLYGTAALIYSRNGIKKMIDLQNNYFCFADYYTFNETDKCYYYTYPMVKQQGDIYSDIAYTTHDLTSWNTYLSYTNNEDYYDYK